jgi:hypothetical protein
MSKHLKTPPTKPEGNSISATSFDSWNDFKARFQEVLFPGQPFTRGRYLFRGHSEPSWKLTPTFDRMFANLRKEKRLQISEELLALFKRALEGFDVPPEARVSDTMLLALGQHYGLPTRLLDWTESPYIAAFFAFNRSVLWGAHDQRIVLWVLDATNPIWSSQFGVEIVDVPSFGNRRIRNQSGKFTLSRTPFASLEEYAAAHGEEDSHALMKFYIPASESTVAIADLDAMGIHHANVYPEIEGAAQLALFRTVVKHNAFVATASTPRPA